jgi:hypothetical protein
LKTVYSYSAVQTTAGGDQFDNLPDPLKRCDRWVLWRKEPRFPGDALTKIPYDPKTLRRARSNDSSTWAPFKCTRATWRARRQRFDGLGFVLGDGCPCFGVDLDDCRDPHTGIIHPRAWAIIQNLRTYCEISPSQRGVKLLGIGNMPTPDGSGKNYRHDPWGCGRGGIELYRRGRFFTLTGNRLDGTPATIEPRERELAALYGQLYPTLPPRPIQRGFRSTDGTGIRRAAAYLARLPASISGNGGHAALLYAACCTLRFGLSDSDALGLLNRFNQRCSPPWADRDITRKLVEAHKLVSSDFGCMLQRGEVR